MKKICFIIPYFGKLPSNFTIWLNSCKWNKTINWIIYTNDKTKYNFPENVQVKYCEFDDLVNKIQKLYNFKVNIDSYWKICYFKPAYGEIFKDDLKGFDYWGHCDMDLIWGDIRKFITDDILEKYDKIGFQGHSTIYKNSDKINAIYKTKVPNVPTYKQIFTGEIDKYCFDENGMEEIFKFLKIDYYKETNFAHLSKYDYSFYLKYLPKEEDYKNKRQVFVWEKGKLKRYFINKKRELDYDEFMYLHFFCRPIKYKAINIDDNAKYIIYPDIVKDFKDKITKNIVNKKGKCSILKYYISSLYYNRKKITLKKIYENTIRMIKWKTRRK